MIYDQDLNACDLVGENLQFVHRHLPEIFDLLVDDLTQALQQRPVVVRASPCRCRCRRGSRSSTSTRSKIMPDEVKPLRSHDRLVDR
jgi:hypothetical protein